MLSDGVYISDDQDARLRSRAPEACRLCKHLLTRKSIVLEQIIVQCQLPRGQDAEVLSYLMMQEAKRGSCGLFDGF